MLPFIINSLSLFFFCPWHRVSPRLKRSRRERRPARPGTYVHVSAAVNCTRQRFYYHQIKKKPLLFSSLTNAGLTKGQGALSIFWSDTLNSTEMFLQLLAPFKESRFSAAGSFKHLLSLQIVFDALKPTGLRRLVNVVLFAPKFSMFKRMKMGFSCILDAPPSGRSRNCSGLRRSFTPTTAELCNHLRGPLIWFGAKLPLNWRWLVVFETTPWLRGCICFSKCLILESCTPHWAPPCPNSLLPPTTISFHLSVQEDRWEGCVIHQPNITSSSSVNDSSSEKRLKILTLPPNFQVLNVLHTFEGPFYEWWRSSKTADLKHITLQWLLYYHFTSSGERPCSLTHALENASMSIACQILSFSFWMQFLIPFLFFTCMKHTGAFTSPPSKCKKNKKVSWNFLAIFLRCTFRVCNLKKNVYIEYIFHTGSFLSHRTTLVSAQNSSRGNRSFSLNAATLLHLDSSSISWIFFRIMTSFRCTGNTLIYPNLWCHWCMVNFILISLHVWHFYVCPQLADVLLEVLKGPVVLI